MLKTSEWVRCSWRKGLDVLLGRRFVQVVAELLEETTIVGTIDQHHRPPETGTRTDFGVSSIALTSSQNFQLVLLDSATGSGDALADSTDALVASTGLGEQNNRQQDDAGPPSNSPPTGGSGGSSAPGKRSTQDADSLRCWRLAEELLTALSRRRILKSCLSSGFRDEIITQLKARLKAATTKLLDLVEATSIRRRYLLVVLVLRLAMQKKS